MMVKRRRFFSFLSNQPPQRYFVVIQFFVLGLIMVSLLYSAIRVFDEYALASAASDLTGRQFESHLKQLQAALFRTSILIFAVGFVVNIFLGLLFLHRIIGPLVKVRRVLNELAEGWVPSEPVYFRRGDFLQDLAESLTKACAVLRAGKEAND